jgi:hypothetical protein
MRNKFQFAATPAVTLVFVLALTGFEGTLNKQERTARTGVSTALGSGGYPNNSSP